MLKNLTEWVPLLVLLISLGGLQLSLNLGLRTDVRALTEQVAGVRERLASLETRVGHIESRLVARHGEAP